MDGRPIWTDCDEAGDYVVPNVLSPRDLVFRPDNMDETVPHTHMPTLTVLSLLVVYWLLLPVLCFSFCFTDFICLKLCSCSTAINTDFV